MDPVPLRPLAVPDNGPCIAKAEGHDGAVVLLAISADGQRVASAGRDGLVLLWARTSSRIAALAQLHVPEPTSMAFAGGFLAVSSGAAVHIFDPNGAAGGVWPLPVVLGAPAEGVVLSLAGHGDRLYFSTASAWGRFDLPSGSSRVFSTSGIPEGIAVLDVDRIALALDGNVLVLDSGTGEQRALHNMSAHRRGRSFCVGMRPDSDGRRVLWYSVAEDDLYGNVFSAGLLDTETGAFVYMPADYDAPHLLPSGTVLSFESGQAVTGCHRLSARGCSVLCARGVPGEPDRVLTGDAHGAVREWSLSAPVLAPDTGVFADGCARVAGEVVTFQSVTRRVTRWSLDDGRVVGTWAFPGRAQRLCVAAGGGGVVGVEGGVSRAWMQGARLDGALRWTALSGEEWSGGAYVSADGRHAGGFRPGVDLVATEEGVVRALPTDHRTWGCAIRLADGDFVSADRAGRVCRRDPTTGYPRWTTETSGVYAILESPGDGAVWALVEGSPPAFVRIDPRTGALGPTVRVPHRGYVALSLHALPDGTVLAGGAPLVRLWPDALRVECWPGTADAYAHRVDPTGRFALEITHDRWVSVLRLEDGEVPRHVDDVRTSASADARFVGAQCIVEAAGGGFAVVDCERAVLERTLPAGAAEGLAIGDPPAAPVTLQTRQAWFAVDAVTGEPVETPAGVPAEPPLNPPDAPLSRVGLDRADAWAVDEDGCRLATVTGWTRLDLWDLSDGTRLGTAELPDAARQVAIPRADRVAVIDVRGLVTVYAADVSSCPP